MSDFELAMSAIFDFDSILRILFSVILQMELAKRIQFNE